MFKSFLFQAVQLKKRRESDRFLSFFDKKEKTERGFEAVQTSSVLNVLPFFCKQGVSLAPTLRRKPLSKEVHDSLLLDAQPIVCFNKITAFILCYFCKKISKTTQLLFIVNSQIVID